MKKGIITRKMKDFAESDMYNAVDSAVRSGIPQQEIHRIVKKAIDRAVRRCAEDATE